MNSLPLVTVIIPCYNHAKYIEQCLDSVYNQTYANIEVIVIDDYSTDDSVFVLKELLNKYSFKLILHKINAGLPKTLNEGITNAKGEYIALLASDDELIDNSILKRVDFLKNSKYLAVFGDAVVIDKNSSVITNSFIQNIRKVPYQSFLNNFSKTIILEWCIPGPVFLASANIFDKKNVGLYNENYIFEDRDMYLRLLANDLLGFLPEKVARYRFLDRGHSLRSTNKCVSQMLKIEIDNLRNFTGKNKIYLLQIICIRIISRIRRFINGKSHLV